MKDYYLNLIIGQKYLCSCLLKILKGWQLKKKGFKVTPPVRISKIFENSQNIFFLSTLGKNCSLAPGYVCSGLGHLPISPNHQFRLLRVLEHWRL